jgi:hypothetical protein
MAISLHHIAFAATSIFSWPALIAAFTSSVLAHDPHLLYSGTIRPTLSPDGCHVICNPQSSPISDTALKRQ